MNPITFTSYSGFGREVVIIAERIVSFHPIDYNGNRGTCICLDTGKEICVSESPGQVRMALEQTNV